jgi:hypothetical protein
MTHWERVAALGDDDEDDAESAPKKEKSGGRARGHPSEIHRAQLLMYSVAPLGDVIETGHNVNQLALSLSVSVFSLVSICSEAHYLLWPMSAKLFPFPCKPSDVYSISPACV